MKRLTTTALALVFSTTSALAFGAHQPDGFRDTGCDPAMQTRVISERTGKVLYFQNASCPAASGPTDMAADDASEDEDDNSDEGDGDEKT